MKNTLFALLALLLLTPMLRADQAAPAQAGPAPVGRADVGKTAWLSPGPYCQNCHGANGEGGFGPDLAGRGLSFAQFQKAVRKPWGIMPAYNEKQMDDQRIADFYAFLSPLPKVAQAAAPRLVASPETMERQRLVVNSYGCAQCHQAEMGGPRRWLGGESGNAVTFERFAKLVYNHTEDFPMGRMGSYSRERLPETTLQEIFRFIRYDLGLLAPITAAVDGGVRKGANTVYTLTVANTGKFSVGLPAEAAIIKLPLPAGATVVSATGEGYKGALPAEGGSGTVATWEVKAIPPDAKQIYTLTITGSPDGFKGANVAWALPAPRRPQGLTLKQANLPEKGDAVNIAVAAPSTSTQ